MGASRQALLCGYYGEHNIGDDALLAALLQQLPSGWTPLVTGYDQAELAQRFGVATCPRRSLKAVLAALGGCQALILGGGSLLQDATSWRSLIYYLALIGAARLSGKPVLLWGQGLGPLGPGPGPAAAQVQSPVGAAGLAPGHGQQLAGSGFGCPGAPLGWHLPGGQRSGLVLAAGGLAGIRRTDRALFSIHPPAGSSPMAPGAGGPG